MRLKPLALAVIAALAVAGCASDSTDLSDITDKSIVAESVLKDRYDFDGEWWKIYRDPCLNKIMELALKNNIDLKKSAINVNRALYQANLIGEELVPEFSAGAGASMSKNLQKGTTTHRYTSEITAGYELDLWRKLRSAASAAEWEHSATVLDYEAARCALINSTVDTYFRIKYLQGAIKAQTENVSYYERLLEIVTNKYTYGQVDSSEPMYARKSLLSARDSLMNLESQMKTAMQTLRDLLNLRPGDNVEISDTDLLDTPLTEVDLDVPISALGLRPDVKAAEYRVQSAFADWESAKTSLYPSISIGGSISTSSTKAREAFNVPFLGGAVSLNLPFLQYNKIRWRIRMSEADFESAKLSLIKSITTALNEVDAHYYNYRKSLYVYENVKNRYETDVNLSAYSYNRYKEGAEELRDYLNAKCSENQTRLGLLEAKYSTINYENAIYRAMGSRLVRKSTVKPYTAPVSQPAAATAAPEEDAIGKLTAPANEAPAAKPEQDPQAAGETGSGA